MTTEQIETRIGAYIDHLNGLHPEYVSFELAPNPNGKYRRVVAYTGFDMTHDERKAAKYSGSVHAFVDADGNVYKAAGWKAPAKGVRYSVTDDASFAKLTTLPGAAWSGGYLYAR